MATEYNGINYFPLLTGFFHSDIMELTTAMFGIKGPHAVIMLLCKIYTEGYYIQWGKEQCMIFARKLGSEYTAETVGEIVNLLVEKGFFARESYEKHRILTSIDIQTVWMEATSRRKRDLSKLPHLLIEITNEKNKSRKPENVNIPLTKMEVNPENEDISGQSKVKQSIVEQSKELPPSTPPRGRMDGDEDHQTSLPEPPAYALNTKTHNYYGLLESLRLHKITEMNEIKAILSLSNYGEKGTPVWKLLAKNNWSKIEAPGKYIIKVLRSS